MQMIIAVRKLDFVRLVELGEDAVRFGKISGDNRLLVTAMRWHGDTYKNYYYQPKTAITIYNDALKCGDISLLNKADIYIGLAVAYAQNHTEEDYETEAQKYAELAQMTMPEYPEQDPLFRFIRTGQSEIDQRVGKVYLILAKRFPTKKEYAQWAYDAYEKATSKQSLSISYRCQALINKADAALGIGKMYSYLDCLEEGVPIARQTDNQQRLIEAVTILQKAPRGWRNEKRYKDLDAIVREIMTPKGANDRTSL